MWIVELAIRRPYTFVVIALLIAILSLSAMVSTPKDIFPNINIPIISVIWQYNGPLLLSSLNPFRAHLFHILG